MSQANQMQLSSGNGNVGEIPFINSDKTWDTDGIEGDAQILIIDDEPEICEEIAEKLERRGFRCVVAMDAKTGLELVHSKASISIILADIRMPDMDGLELCKIIKNEISEERELAILIMTGHAGLSEAISALKLGALDFLTKPLSPEYLVHAVTRADGYIKARALERNFTEQLKELVSVKTSELRQRTSDLEKANSALIIANQVKDEFLTMVGHELRTPLTTIVGSAGIIEPNVVDPKQRELIVNIKKAGWRLTKVINSMIDMVSVETKTFQLNLSDVDVSELIEQTVSVYRGKAKMAGVIIDLDNISATSAKLDPVRISQSVGRLIDNAIKFSSVGDMVQISAQQTDDGLTISVQDDGVGMNEPEIMKSHEPLQKIDVSPTKIRDGISAGLFLAKKFAELHEGTLSIESNKNQGNSVTIVIPNQISKLVPENVRRKQRSY